MVTACLVRQSVSSLINSFEPPQLYGSSGFFISINCLRLSYTRCIIESLTNTERLNEMSTIEAKYGALTFSKKEFLSLRKKMMSDDKARQEMIHSLAVCAFEKITELAKGVRNFNKYSKALSFFPDIGYTSSINVSPLLTGGRHSEVNVSNAEGMLIMASLFGVKNGLIFMDGCEPKKLLKPKKKDFPVQKINEQKNISFDCGEDGGVALFEDSLELRWITGSDYCAVKDIQDHPVYHSMNSALAAVKWTASTGGVFYRLESYCDEYGEVVGSLHKKIDKSFGPNGEKIKNLEGQLRKLT